jgi:hypothetical protein
MSGLPPFLVKHAKTNFKKGYDNNSSSSESNNEGKNLVPHENTG